jgi:ferritin-like metal-binding protein YciE
MSMSKSENKKIVQYLEEALATERALVRVLQSQILMTPRGSYRSALETHLRETKDHADRVSRRLDALGRASNPAQTVVGIAETVAGQVLALGKTPIDLLRGTSREEKILKNAKDASATEALEIATYTAIERLARAVGDGTTAELAASILADEERMLETVLREIPALAEAVVRGEIGAEPPVASARDLAIPRYDALPADEIVARLAALSAADRARIDAYERANKNRVGVLRAAQREHSTA